MTADLGDVFDVAVDCLHAHPDHIARALRQVPRSAVYGVRAMVGVMRADIEDSGFYQATDEGAGVMVVPEGQPDGLGWKTIDELVAFRTDRPGRWGVRRGGVPLLGVGLNDALHDYAATLGEPIMLYENPSGWLQADGRGLVVLDWAFNPLDHFKGLNIRCETPALAKRLDARRCAAARSAFVIEEARHDA